MGVILCAIIALLVMVAAAGWWMALFYCEQTSLHLRERDYMANYLARLGYRVSAGYDYIAMTHYPQPPEARIDVQIMPTSETVQ